MTPEEWENLCDGCGKCCEIPGTGTACPGLDTCSNKCSVYKERFTKYHCLKVRPCNVHTLHKAGTLPDSCAYVRLMKGEPQLENPKPAKLAPFVIAGEETRRIWNNMRKLWFDMWGDKEPYK